MYIVCVNGNWKDSYFVYTENWKEKCVVQGCIYFTLTKIITSKLQQKH